MKPTIGRIVHYSMPDGQIRPALIVRTWPEIESYNDGVNLQVFTDDNPAGTGNDKVECPWWRASVQRADAPTPGCWHWPPAAPSVSKPKPLLRISPSLGDGKKLELAEIALAAGYVPIIAFSNKVGVLCADEVSELLGSSVVHLPLSGTREQDGNQTASTGLNPEEAAMLGFLKLCVPSLSPEAYEGILEICRRLCGTRKALGADSLEKCLDCLLTAN